jgi:hypothetical protein
MRFDCAARRPISVARPAATASSRIDPGMPNGPPAGTTYWADFHRLDRASSAWRTH